MFWKIVFWTMIIFAVIGVLIRLIMYVGFVLAAYKTEGFWTALFTGSLIFIGGVWDLIKIPLGIIFILYLLDIGGCVQTAKKPNRSIVQEKIVMTI